MRNLIIIVLFGVGCFFAALYILYGSRKAANVTPFNHTISYSLLPKEIQGITLDSAQDIACVPNGLGVPQIFSSLAKDDYYSEILDNDSVVAYEEKLFKNDDGPKDGIVNIGFNEVEEKLLVICRTYVPCSVYDMRTEFRLQGDSLLLYYFPVEDLLSTETCFCSTTFKYTLKGVKRQPKNIKIFRRSFIPKSKYFAGLGPEIFKKKVLLSPHYDQIRNRVSPKSNLVLSDSDRMELKTYLGFQDRVITFYAEQIDRLKTNRFDSALVKKEDLKQYYSNKLTKTASETAMILLTLRCFDAAKTYVNFAKQYCIGVDAETLISNTELTIKRDQEDLFGIYAVIQSDDKMPN